MILLLHPTHRKFIKLLRNKVNNGDVIYITKEDQSEWQSVFNTSKNSKKRHQETYRIFLLLEPLLDSNPVGFFDIRKCVYKLEYNPLY